MRIAGLRNLSRPRAGFTLAEVCIAMAVSVIFGMAAFATNQRLLLSVKAQKETSAATMALQWRMETFRATVFSDIATRDTVKNNILIKRTGTMTNTNGSTITIDPFAGLSSIREQFTIGVYPPDGSTNTVISWDAAHPNGQDISTNNNLGNAKMLKVDVLETWISANGRQRQRQLSTICTLGNLGI
jgi:Tfp pilus assembly protein PilE